MNDSKLTMAFLGVMTALAMVLPVEAGTIASLASVSGGGTAVVSPIITGPGLVNNDDVEVVGGNIVIASKTFDVASPIDIVFNVASSREGVTEYYFAEGVTNNTSNAMVGYIFELGFGTGSTFVPSTPTDGLDFDAPSIGGASGWTPIPTSDIFSILSHGDDVLVWSGGSLGAGLSGAFTFSIDVPDLDQFTLRQRGTTVPAPGAFLLVGLGTGLVGYMRRRRSI